MATLSTNALTALNLSFTDVINNTPTVNANGYFIETMTSLNKYIQDEFTKNRITGNDYAQVLIAAMQYGLQSAFEYTFREKQLEFEWNKTQEELELIRAQTRKTIAEAELAELQLEIGQATKADLIAKAANENSLILAQVAVATAQENKLNEETKLVTAKITTETKQQAVLTEQIKVYSAQAISFKKRHEADLLKTHINAAIGTAGGSTVLDFLKGALGTQGANITALATQAKTWS